MSKTYFFYFTHLFLQNTHISLSIIHIYSNKIFISLTQPNSHCHHHLPPSLSRSTPLASHYATRSTPESTQANHTEILKKTSKKKKEKKRKEKRNKPSKKIGSKPTRFQATNPSENSVRVVGDGLIRRLSLLDLVLIGGSGDQRMLEEERSQPKMDQNPRDSRRRTRRRTLFMLQATDSSGDQASSTSFSSAAVAIGGSQGKKD